MAVETHSIRKFHKPKVACLPRCYKDVEKILQTAKSCASNLKTALHNSRHRGGHFRKVYALSFKVLKHSSLLEKIIDETDLLKKERFLSKEIVAIMIYELMLGRGSIPGEHWQVCNLMKHYDDIQVVFKKCQNTSVKNDAGLDRDLLCLPRYARINTLVTTVSYVLKDLKKNGFEEVIYADDISENAYLDILKSLQNSKFIVDHHFKDLLVFSGKENVTNLPLYEKGHLLLQDKSSYIPVHVLDPEPDSLVIDACAAPGMKSMHLAAKMENKGILHTYERCNSRFKMLQNMLQYGSVKIAKTFCQDFKKTDPYDELNSSVKYILLDPSCSGSGMVSRMDSVTDTEESKNVTRLQKLAGFQIILLKHALRFPSVKRVVYSTCSVTEEENEYVIQEALNCFDSSFRLVHIMPEWSVRGSKNYEFGHMCVRAYPDKNLTNGFFVAMFERIENNLGLNSYDLKRNKVKGSFKGKKYKHIEALSKNKEVLKSPQEQFNEVKIKKKKNRKKESKIKGLNFNKLESSNDEKIKIDTDTNLDSPENNTHLKYPTQMEEVIKKRKRKKQGNIYSVGSVKRDAGGENSVTSKENPKSISDTVTTQHCKKRKKR